MSLCVCDAFLFCFSPRKLRPHWAHRVVVSLLIQYLSLATPRRVFVVGDFIDLIDMIDWIHLIG